MFRQSIHFGVLFLFKAPCLFNEFERNTRKYVLLSAIPKLL